MEWRKITDQHRRCLKWVPYVYLDKLETVTELGKKAEEAERAFRDAKRIKEKPAKLKTLKAEAGKAWTALDKGMKLASAKGVYIIQDATGFVILHNSTGSKRHSTYPDLKQAQVAAAKLLK